MFKWKHKFALYYVANLGMAKEILKFVANVIIYFTITPWKHK